MMTELEAIRMAHGIVVPLLAASRRSPIVRDTVDLIARLFPRNKQPRAQAEEFVRRARATRLYDAQKENPTHRLVIDLARAIIDQSSIAAV